MHRVPAPRSAADEDGCGPSLRVGLLEERRPPLERGAESVGCLRERLRIRVLDEGGQVAIRTPEAESLAVVLQAALKLDGVRDGRLHGQKTRPDTSPVGPGEIQFHGAVPRDGNLVGESLRFLEGQLLPVHHQAIRVDGDIHLLLRNPQTESRRGRGQQGSVHQVEVQTGLVTTGFEDKLLRIPEHGVFWRTGSR